MWFLFHTFWIKGKYTTKLQNFFKNNEKWNLLYQNSWNTGKALISIKSYEYSCGINKNERTKINEFSSWLKILEKERYGYDKKSILTCIKLNDNKLEDERKRQEREVNQLTAMQRQQKTAYTLECMLEFRINFQVAISKII